MWTEEHLKLILLLPFNLIKSPINSSFEVLYCSLKSATVFSASVRSTIVELPFSMTFLTTSSRSRSLEIGNLNGMKTTLFSVLYPKSDLMKRKNVNFSQTLDKQVKYLIILTILNRILKSSEIVDFWEERSVEKNIFSKRWI